MPPQQGRQDPETFRNLLEIRPTGKLGSETQIWQMHKIRLFSAYYGDKELYRWAPVRPLVCKDRLLVSLWPSAAL